MDSTFNAFFSAVTINQIIPTIYREVVYLQTSNYITTLMVQPSVFPFFLTQYIIPPPVPAITMLPHQILSANAKSLSSLSPFCSYLRNINSDSRPLFVSVSVISPMLRMPVKEQICYENWTRLCFVSAWLGIASAGRCLLCRWNICCLDLQHKVFIRKEVVFESALKSTE